MTVTPLVRPPKPLDVGNGRIAGSVARNGGLLAFGVYSWRHGYATLDCAPPFPDDRRHDPDAVRAYRASLADGAAPSLGLVPDGPWQILAVDAGDGATPTHRLRAGPVEAEVSTVAVGRGQDAWPVVVQHWRLTTDRDRRVAVPMSWGGRLWLARAAFTQLTEGGVLPSRRARHQVGWSGAELVISVPELDLEAAIAGVPAPFTADTDGNGPVQLHGDIEVTIAPGSEWRLAVAVAVGSSADDVARLARDAIASARDRLPTSTEPRAAPSPEAAAVSAAPPALRPLVRRAISYLLACCTVPTHAGTCLVTDHRILPLSWSRDAYYCARLLLVCGTDTGADVVRHHLHWLLRTAERPHGFVARSYLPNGKVKDHAFQLDQQCYPLLELVDFVEVTGEAAVAVEVWPVAQELLDQIERRRARDHALYTTDETPGDDPLALPYHFSSHVLLWHTLSRLARLADHLGVDGGTLADRAAAVRRDTRQAFAVTHEDGRRFAYAVDLDGSALAYHDANDLPTVLAPVWGFCEARDPVWRATMAFAFSPQNHAGYFAGAYGGLGSSHTPGPWPLGDVQELLFARLTGDTTREAVVVDRLAATACVDGALPEARDEITGQVRSRHWFAWPGAALALATLDPAWQVPVT